MRLYSALDHIARSLWLNQYDQENLMAMLYSAYFDASGKKETHASITVAGAVAPLKKWARFERDWKIILDEYGVGEFHATDFASSLGEYRGWKGEKAKRSEFLKRLGQVTRSTVNKLFIVTVEMDAWKTVNDRYLLAEVFHSPYAIAGYSAVHMVKRWARRKEIRSPIEFFFEDGDGDRDWAGLTALCARENIIPIRLPKTRAIPCQVGDMLAWKTRTASQNTLVINKKLDSSTYNPDLFRQVIEELKSLDKALVKPADNAVFSPDAMLRTCVKSNIPRRSGIHPTPTAVHLSHEDRHGRHD